MPDSAAGAENGLPRDAYALLAQANLLRVRGQWDEAVARCMAALQIAPGHASAQSLLGDIYENQGAVDDAIRWYRLALDVCPDSPADKIKLERLLEAKNRELLLDPTRTGQIFVPQPLRPAPWYAHSDRALRAAALVALIVLALGGLAVAISHPPALRKTAPTPQGMTAPLTGPPLPLAVSPNAVTDPNEQSLLHALSQSPDLIVQGITPVGVQIDPRAGRVTLTILCKPPAGQPADRAWLMRSGLIALQTLQSETDASAAQFTLRCLLPSEGGASPLVFVADASRTVIPAASADPASLTSEQMQAVYTAPWWSTLVGS